MTTTVYTDGACLGNPGPGGWAWAVPGGAFASGAAARTTNQRMEIAAVLEAARSLDGHLDIASDSTYVVHCFRDRWWEGWLARGWKTVAKKPVANRDLWEPLLDLYRADPQRLKFRWVKGHSGDVMNDLVDRLAVEAAQTQDGRSGDAPPTEVGPADVPAAGADGRDPRLPPGRLIVIGGHRPPELGGYDANPVADSVRRRLAEILAAKQELHGDAVVATGLGLGAEQLGAEAAVEAGVPFVAVLPYPDQESVWPKRGQQAYRSLLDQAARTVILQTAAPESRQKAGAALARRNGFLARHADEAVVVWDGRDDLVGRLVRSFRDAIGEEDIWIIPPQP
jgi:ribonuclease HI